MKSTIEKLIEWLSSLSFGRFLALFVLAAIILSELLIVVQSYWLTGLWFSKEFLIVGFLTPMIDATIVGFIAAILIDLRKKDVRDKNKLVEELKESEARFRDLTESSSDWFWEMDSALRFSYFSSKFQEITGFKKREILGLRRDEIGIDGVTEDEMQAHMKSLENHLPFRDFIYSRPHNGKLIWLSISGLPVFDSAGGFQGYRGTGSDVTTRINLEHELAAANKAKDDFLASMSHELRTPLTSIIGNSEFLLDEGSCGSSKCPHKDAGTILNSIQNAGKNQLALVNDILDMSKIESGKFTIDESPYNLSLLLDELKQMFSVRAADTGIQFVIDQKNHESHLLMGDVQRISQILINLIGNAIKFTEQGEVRLTSWVNAGNLIFQVKDSGIGMSREAIDNLFQQFHQADGRISRRFGGTGLGLYISENLADLMGGVIDASSEEGVGSVFQLTIPYQPTETAVQSSEMEHTQPSVMDEKISGHILIAEDTPELQMLEKRILESIGLTVAVASDGQEAIDLVNQHPFDLVLMDMQMPNVDGIAATRILREQGHTLPIIALTANVMQKHRDAFNEAGCDGFLGKPIDKRELRRVLLRHLTLKQDQQKIDQMGIVDRRKGSRRSEEIAVIDDDREEQSKPRRLRDQVDQALRTATTESNHQPEAEVDDELMAIFVESNSQRVTTLKQALSEEDWQQVRGVAHAIKGSAASFGYPQLSEMAEQLQFSIDEERMDGVAAMAENLLVELDKLLP